MTSSKKKAKIKLIVLFFIFYLISFILPLSVLAADPPVANQQNNPAFFFPVPALQLSMGQAANPAQVASTLEIIALLTILSLAPAILILTTPFTRIVIIFNFLRQALGIQTTPPNQVIIGFSLFLTFFIMKPVWQDVYQNSLNPYLEREIDYKEAFEKAKIPVKKFMLVHTRESDLALFVKSTKAPHPQTQMDTPLLLLLPAFVISELKTAFIVGFILYIPFLIIDMVVASILLSMGMMMLPPIMISLPFKLMLFVLIDGWALITGSVLKSFGL